MNKHALVIGGTGMLKDVSRWLAGQGYHVSVIARNQQRLQALADASPHPERFSLLSVDYQDRDRLSRMAEETLRQHGPASLMVA